MSQSPVIVNLPNASNAQQLASDPLRSVWVAANAGTGKTKVLTDRVLRLLLKGVQPSRILCITYTKAAAAEMQNRIHATLSGWVELNEAELRGKLAGLTGEAVSERLLRQARTLFARVLDAPDGVRILTIHSFCQSLLRRFPLEAGVVPHFDVIDERTAGELLAESQHRLLAYASTGENPELSEAVALLAGRMAEGTFRQLLSALIAQRADFDAAINEETSAVFRLKSRMAEILNVQNDLKEDDIIQELISNICCYDKTLRAAINDFERGTNGDRRCAEVLARWLGVEGDARAMLWPEFSSLFLTGKGEPRASVVGAAIAKANPALKELMEELRARVHDCAERLRAFSLWRVSAACVTVVAALLEYYDGFKRQRALMDYEDLVLKALGLLRQEGVAPWVLFKLDGGLDHVLIDEAQDTGPAQWELVERLVGEFFAGQGGHGDRPIPRTLFVVGDEKQSIYGFQGAAPKAFSEKRRDFQRRAEAARVAFSAVPLGLSYRSTAAVLAAVDAVSNQPQVRAGLTYGDESEVVHGAFRAGQAGHVEVWPLLKTEVSEKVDLFNVARSNYIQRDGKEEIAERIANRIKAWLKDGEWLASQGRPVKAGDILILVRKRGDFVPAMVRALKRAEVPVAGADRLQLTEHIAVMDMLALAEFLLLPEDDLSLACVLKSPLCGVDEETLFQLAYDRGKVSLWSRVRNSGLPVAEWLSALLDAVDYARPYELFARVLEGGARRRYAARLGEEAFDPLDEFLSLALQYEQGHVPSLQGFLQWMRTGRVEVKRDMEQGMDAVRIMTVHGAKGLQAPIVFLPDTTGKATGGGQGVNPPFWFTQDGKPLMLWSASKDMDVPLTAGLREQRKQQEAEEFRRLLYVALTRAADRLYICGWQGAREVPEDCWYRWIDSALRPLGKPLPLPFGDGEEGYFLDSPQTAAVPDWHAEERQGGRVALPAHLMREPAAEPYPPQPLVPSRGDDMAASSGPAHPKEGLLSPALEVQAARFKRGNLVHRLLQFLPDVAPQAREAALAAYLSRFAGEESPAAHKALTDEVMTVLAHPDLAPVFAPDALSEVALTGLVPGEDGKKRILSGRIDRLRVTEEGIWLVDYKTGREAPARIEDVPVAYLRQMAAYRAALRSIYPGRPIQAALVWTSAPMLMYLPDTLLDEALTS